MNPNERFTRVSNATKVLWQDGWEIVEGHEVDDWSVFALRRKALSLNSGIKRAALWTSGRISSLEYLDLEWSDDITDQGLRGLYNLESLRWLDVGFCRLITSNGVAALRSALPLCEIDDEGTGRGT